jgi:hypothetical protein
MAGFGNMGRGFGQQGAAGGFGQQGAAGRGFGQQGAAGGFGQQGAAGRGFGQQGAAGGFGQQGAAGRGFGQQGAAGGFGQQGAAGRGFGGLQQGAFGQQQAGGGFVQKASGFAAGGTTGFGQQGALGRGFGQQQQGGLAGVGFGQQGGLAGSGYGQQGRGTGLAQQRPGFVLGSQGQMQMMNAPMGVMQMPMPMNPYSVERYGDSRDDIISRFNSLQASLGCGKHFHSESPSYPVWSIVVPVRRTPPCTSLPTPPHPHPLLAQVSKETEVNLFKTVVYDLLPTNDVSVS